MRNKTKWIITIIAGICLLAMVIGLAVSISRSTTETRLGAEAYSVGIINTEDGKINKEEKGSIYTRDKIKLEDIISIELDDDAEIEYLLFFYDEEGKFLSTGTDVDGVDNAKTVRIMITPTDDNNDKVSALFELSRYAKQLEVKISK